MRDQDDQSTVQYVRRADVPFDVTDPAAALKAQLGDGRFSAIILFITPKCDIPNLMSCCEGVFPETYVMGCTTAGELGADGYQEGHIIAIGLPCDYFVTKAMLIENVTEFESQPIIDRVIQNRVMMQQDFPDWPSEFNFILVDGLSVAEDSLMAGISTGFGPVQVFGGSAGDGTDFGQTFILFQGQIYQNAAVILQVRTICNIQVFKSDHFAPTEERMVVTGADPKRRIVHEINAEPAAREYARILGKDPNQLSTFTFAAHPLVVRIGGEHHVRSIQRVAENGDLVFFSAIDEGLVLTLARPMDLIAHTKDFLNEISADQTPDIILTCDCLLRRVEAEQNQQSTAMSRLFRENRVYGFSTYGEQLNAMHVNQTMTGVAIYPPSQGD
jgi:hypothetical protein